MARIDSMVVAVDFSAPSRAATERARTLAKRWGARLHLVHSARFPMPAMSHEFAIPGPEWETIRDAAQKELDAIAANLEADGLRVTREVSQDAAVSAILDASKRRDAGLIVMGSHGHTGLEHLMLGSVAERTLRSARVPVLVVKEAEAEAGGEIKRILLASDFSPHAAAAAELAVEFAAELDASVDICHVHALPSTPWFSIEAPPPADWAEALKRLAGERIQDVLRRFEAAGVEARTHLVEDTPSLAIPSLAEELGADLIVMGTRGNTGLKHVLLGSVAERTVRIATCSVLTTAQRGAEGH